MSHSTATTLDSAALFRPHFGMQVIDPQGEPVTLQLGRSVHDAPDHSHVSQDYRDHPPGVDSSSEASDGESSGLDECVNRADDEEDDDANTWLADPPRGIRC